MKMRLRDFILIYPKAQISKAYLSQFMDLYFSIKNYNTREGIAVHFHNFSYYGGRDRRMEV
jgi:hypothetical protein